MKNRCLRALKSYRFKIFLNNNNNNNFEYRRSSRCWWFSHKRVDIQHTVDRKAFGACTYVRWKLTDGKFGVRFVAAKSRIAPLKELTIPRLELQAAVLASRLAKSIQEETRLKILRTMFFSDSRVTLAWIQGMPRFYKPFVSCRVSEIQSNSKFAD